MKPACYSDSITETVTKVFQNSDSSYNSYEDVAAVEMKRSQKK